MSTSSFYTFEMKVNGIDFPDPLSTCTFAIKQSIFSLYPQLVINYFDMGGILNETFSMEVGTKVEIRLMVGDEPIFRSLFYVYKSSTEEIRDILSGMGKFTVHCIHVMAWRQKIKSRAFRDRISNIIKEIAEEYSFEYDVNDTGNADIWYQCNITDGQFLMNQLLPNAWSHNAEGTPFYCYLDIQNILHLRHLKSFVKDNHKFALFMEQNSKTIVLPDNTKIEKGGPLLYSYKRDLVNIFDFANTHLMDTFEINRDNGNLSRKKVDIFNQPVSNLGNLLYINPIKDPLKIEDNYFTQFEIGKQENSKGKVIQQSRAYPGIEKITLLLIFHTDTMIDLGDKIRLLFFKTDLGTGMYSEKMSDDYFATDVDFLWDNDKSVMYQRVVLTRTSVIVPTWNSNRTKFLALEPKIDPTATNN